MDCRPRIVSYVAALAKYGSGTEIFPVETAVGKTSQVNHRGECDVNSFLGESFASYFAVIICIVTMPITVEYGAKASTARHNRDL